MSHVRRGLPLLAALLAGACGSSAHSSAGSSSRHPPDPNREVQNALVALSSRSFHESFTQVGRDHATGVPAAQAGRLAAKLRGAVSTESGVVRLEDVRNFQARITSSDAGTRYVKAVNGSFRISTDGVHYQPASAADQQTLSTLFQNGFASLTRGASHAQDKGPRTVNGTRVEEYTAIFSASTLRSELSAAGSLPPGATLRDGKLTMDLDRATGLPVHMVDVLSLSIDLASLGQAGLRGHLITVVTSTRTFSHFGPAG